MPVSPGRQRELRSWTLTPGATGQALSVTRNPDLWAKVAEVLDVECRA